MTINTTQKIKIASYYHDVDNGGLSIDVYKEPYVSGKTKINLYTIEFSSDYFGYPSVKSVIGPIHKEYLDFYIESFKDLGNKVNV